MTQPTVVAKTNTLAVIAFVTAFVVPVAGLVIAVVARRQLSAPGNTESGNGFARWAMVIGAIGVLFQTVFLIIWISAFSMAFTHLPPTG
jgi:hypothetical protein